jgi:hypothetical protein
MNTSLPEDYRAALTEMVAALGDVQDYGTFQASELAAAISDPIAYPAFDRRTLVLAALILGGKSTAAFSLGMAELTGNATDTAWIATTALAALEAGQSVAVLPHLARLRELDGAGAVELFTANADSLIANERYSEAADYLDLGLQFEPHPSLLAPVLGLRRLRLWAACRRRCHMPVFDSSTGKLELPAQLRERCLIGFREDLRRIRSMVEGTGMVELALASTVLAWLRSSRGADIATDESLSHEVSEALLSMMGAAGVEGASS